VELFPDHWVRCHLFPEPGTAAPSPAQHGCT
jgi:hypothetical protein